MTNTASFSRRSFMKAGAVAGAALVIDFYVPSKGEAAAAAAFAPNAYLSIGADGKVTLMLTLPEVGQGVHTSLPMIIAEELEVDWKTISFERAAFDKSKYGEQGIGGSSSVSDNFAPLRKAGAQAREMLIQAAAEGWGVAKETCRARNGFVIHQPSDRRAAYGSLVEAAAKIAVPAEPPLKDPKDFRIIGTRIRRVDSPEKTDGSAMFGMDLKVPGMLYAVIARSPVFGGKAVSFDATKAKAIKGVRDVVQPGRNVVVIAENTWAAIAGRDALEIKWDDGPNAAESTAGLRRMFEAESQKEGKAVRNDGDAQAALASAARKLDAVYETPFLAHAPMEPLNCTAHVTKDGCEIWAANQIPDWGHNSLAANLKLPPASIKMRIPLMGGSFGRRINPDYVIEAALVSKAANAPVKVVWTREDDIQHDHYRPASYHVINAGLDAGGLPVAWRHHVLSTSIKAFYEPDAKDGLEGQEIDGVVDLPYSIPNIRVEYSHVPSAVPRGWWRSVENSQNTFVAESFVDELAAAAGHDPLEFRLRLLGESRKIERKAPNMKIDIGRLKGVLQLAASKAGWGKPLPKGSGRGIAAQYCFRSYVAHVAEVTVAKDGRVRVDRVVCAVDCGMVVNPDTVEAQMESAVVFGLTAALKGEITVEKGRIQQSNFHDYRMLRINEMPKVEVYIVPSRENFGGIGEPGVPPVAPAVTNAIFAATGKRIRRLPVSADLLKEA
ncbi:MAG TPA: xanthine dehydrogenase family protein molybdopterin-binding subunit [Blastocatellia bacterium]|nr:xanthine dehydrogenase family protein molybdopterin-binding subunit [Blastocatellia bacterium]